MFAARYARLVVLLLAGLGGALSATAAEPAGAGTIDIQHPYARATAPGQPNAGIFMQLVNRGQADRLISADADVAARTELHTMHMDGDVMRMRHVEGIDLPAGQTVALAPGGLHVMLLGLKHALPVGSHVNLTLTFAKAGKVTLDVPAEAVSAAPAMAH